MPELKAQIAISADASGVEVGVGKAKKSLKDLGASASAAGKQASAGLARAGDGGADAAKKVDAATRNIERAIQRQIAVQEAGSRTGSKYWEVIAGQRGADVNALRPLLNQLDAVSAKQGLAAVAAEGTSKAFSGTAKTARELQFAARGLPAQFTDIATSLSAGQRPLQVLLQQGGQIKDTFGGVGPALRAMAGYIAGLINPFTVAAVAVGAFALAQQKGADEAVEFNKALILTGGHAGKTADQLNSMAAEMDESIGTHRAAAEALAQVASTGRFTADQIGLVATASEKMRLATGRAVKDTVAEFIQLSKDPVKAVLDLNEKYHFLTDATYRQIKALQDQGDQQAASTLAMKTFSDELDKRTKEIDKSIGSLERGWKNLKSWAAEAWDAMLGIGRPDTIAELEKQLADLERRRANTPRKDSQFLGALDHQIEETRNQIARMNAEASRAGMGNGTVDSEEIRRGEEEAKKRGEAAKRAAEKEAKERLWAAERIREGEEQFEKDKADAWKFYSQMVNADLEQQKVTEKTIIDQQIAGIEAQITAEREAGLAANGGKSGLEDMKEKTKAAAQAARDLGLSFSSAFEDAVLGGKKLGDVLGGLAKDAARIFLRQSVTAPLAKIGGDFFTNLFTFNAKGSVYDSPSLSQYSNQVHTSPKLFAFASGAGVFAEAGPEAIMPLHRGPDGKLGVKSAGGGDTNVSITVQSDGSSRSESGDGRSMELGRRLEAAVRGVLVAEKRPGGLLAGA